MILSEYSSVIQLHLNSSVLVIIIFVRVLYVTLLSEQQLRQHSNSIRVTRDAAASSVPDTTG